MVQSYYTLQQAAEVLGKTTDEMNQMVRRNEIRAFADGGSWKFRTQDIDELKRTQELLSEVDILAGSDDDLDLLFEDSTPSVEIKSPSDSTIGRELQADPGLKGSGESDVRLIFSGEDSGSDSDIKLVPDFGDDEPKFTTDNSAKSPGDSDIHLLLEDDDGSETLSLKQTPSSSPAPSDSDIRLFIEDLEPSPSEETPPASAPAPPSAAADEDSEPDFLLDDASDEPDFISETKEDTLAPEAPSSEATEVFSLASQPTEEFSFESEPTPPAAASDSGLIPLASDEDELDLFADSDDDLVLEEAKDVPPKAPESTPTVAAAAKKDDEFSFDDDDLGIDFKLDGAEDIDLADLDLADKTPTIKQEAGDDSDSDFDLNLDDDIGLAQDVTPGAGDSGINLARPDDSGILLKKAADSGIKLRKDDDTDSSDSEFDVSLESDDDIFGSDETPGFKASDTAPRMSPVEEDSSDEISDSDFELAIDDVELDDDEESGSEVVAVSEDDEEDSSDDFDDEDDDEAYGSENVEHVVVNAEPAPWGGLWVGFLSATTIVFAVVMMVMYEITRNAWSYNEPYSLSATIIETIYGLGKGILY